MITTIQEAVRFGYEHGLMLVSDAQIANEQFAQCWIDRVAEVQMKWDRLAVCKGDPRIAAEAYHSAVAEANRYSKII